MSTENISAELDTQNPIWRETINTKLLYRILFYMSIYRTNTYNFEAVSGKLNTCSSQYGLKCV